MSAAEIQESEFHLYTGPDGKVQVQVFFHDENIWMTQERMAQLFGKSISTINEHIKNIYIEEELTQEHTLQKFGNPEFQQKPANYYNLDMIITVGNRTKSSEARHFRKWARHVLGEYVIKGFVMDDERLKNGQHFGKDYFAELLERIRDIRTSEMRVHQQLGEIFALASDYDAKSDMTKEFFAFIQNKLHYAITGNTAAEVVHGRVDSTKDKMGLTTWKGAPDKKILKSDVTVAKNYLSEEELSKLRQSVTAFLDIAETRATQGTITTMKEWVGLMKGYLDLSGYPNLEGAGTVSVDAMREKAHAEYDKYKPLQDKAYISELDKHINKLGEKNE